MKKNIIIGILMIISISLCIIPFSYASTIPNEITVKGVGDFPIRNNSLVLVLQPVPDNSGDYTMTLCNKQGHCRQTSMQYDEIRYIGLFLEDAMPALRVELNKNISSIEQWKKARDEFSSFYADYMNAYDNQHGALKNLFRLQKK